jgi:hypothetical protein
MLHDALDFLENILHLWQLEGIQKRLNGILVMCTQFRETCGWGKVGMVVCLLE